MTDKAMTLRLSQEQRAELEAVARVDGVSVSEAVRQAISEHIDARRRDKKFVAQVAQILDEDRELLERLAKR